MSGFTIDELDEARLSLLELGLVSRYDDDRAAAIMLGFIGQILTFASMLADDIEFAPAAYRRAAALYAAWRQLPARYLETAESIEPVTAVPAVATVPAPDSWAVPSAFDQPSDAELERVVEHLREPA